MKMKDRNMTGEEQKIESEKIKYVVSLR